MIYELKVKLAYIGKYLDKTLLKELIKDKASRDRFLHVIRFN